MFSYRHGFHAGNHADVLKHMVLIAVLKHLTAKPTALTVVDTHAGAGLYRLDSDFAGTSGEAQDGIVKLLASPLAAEPPQLLADYLELIASFNPSGKKKIYPGSPFIAHHLLREHDKLKLFELHPTDARTLSANIAQLEAGRQITVLRDDGFGSATKFLPPPSRRALVLCDPSYEIKSDYARVLDFVAEALKRFATGSYAIWYPIKLRTHVAPFHRWLRGCGREKILIAELLLHPDDSNLRLNGCGLAIVNTPWQVDKRIGDLLPLLQRPLTQGRFGGQRLEWLA